MNRRIFLKGLGSAILAANLLLMPRQKEPDRAETQPSNLATVDLSVDDLRRMHREFFRDPYFGVRHENYVAIFPEEQARDMAAWLA